MRRAGGLATTALVLAAISACSSEAAADPAAEASATAAALSSAAHAKPGTYGTPVNPSLPAPTNVATDAPVTTTPSTQDGTVFVTYAEWNPQTHAVEVSGYLAGVAEDDGTCTLTLTKGSTSATATHPGTSNVTSTACGQLAVPANRVSSGTWTAVVTYRSATSKGSSKPVQVTVP